MVNKIFLIGNLGRDPDMTYTPAGKAVTKFSLAVSRRWTDRESNERREETTWFNIVAWDQLAERCSQYLHKGSKVFIEGRMSSHKYTDKDGVERTAWDVIANDMQMLDTKAESQALAGRSGGGSGATASGGGLDPENDLPF